MTAKTLSEGLTTAHLADACLRLGIAPRCAALRAVSTGARLTGRCVPVRHYGSVDIFLEAIDSAKPGDALIVDNAGRTDESCVGDLVALEAATAGLSGIVIWGCHRDTAEIRELGLPVFSLGANPAGPVRLDPRSELAFASAVVGDFSVTADDFVVADDDGVLFLPADQLDDLIRAACSIRDTEQLQARRAKEGETLRSQLRFAEYLERKKSDPSLTFRKHLQSLRASIEE
ncbi:MAG: RraA family protein [Candidatus Eremiobacteraeota bacterium]|nr:RraA family protein [Candidatus Eremiobacteraeota bacterium]